MPPVDPGLLSMFDEWAVDHAVKHWGLSQDEAIRRFLGSETHAMLADPETLLWHDSPLVIIDMFENERANGDPRWSTYIQGDSLYVR
ncbi:MAG: hypothetical protein LBK42_10645 [Propionibacteriaceae bacterium]|jgi:hypothetical protein|nr:hypothetical protein [Propionibacteriaceae bacterium]